MTSRPGPSLAQRKRQLVADELTEAALQLLALKGFDGVTVDEIVAAAGVSKRTFFRYFASKEDVVVQFLADMGTDMCAELASRPAGEPPSTALLRTVLVPLTTCGDHSEKALPLVRLILRTPALHARFLERQAQWREGLSTELARRLGLDPAADLYPHLAAGMALTAFDTVLWRWSENEAGDDPAELAEQAFAVIGTSLDTVG
ncbi:MULTISPECIES: TetR family transcriptional regulator [Streptomyces]|uniref:TetR family transcriptional regulator n=1 Tax=Streptomyces fungicidicus TaxID=68203 RepID=A0ACC7Y3N2_9ACTN|nr:MULTISPECIES: TetR family transcriptional regulator [Streptomyces]MBF4133171.1 TetR family transcriptional regulator [Streptomyces albidoflavus]NUV76306.1 TetR family transcriptional regulator [Streptomyces fungicidicus]PAX85923.1 TetR family transcriptional regulator [Streptomyces albidoflavus]PAX89853.1 TetR family transcriptional regulator [Streptomyces albidoflavus]PBO18448.1 TetR family transcriptional regulator [Streptomyces albidoflavus]